MIHLVTKHNGTAWMEDLLVDGDYEPKVRELLGGNWDRTRELIPDLTRAFYRGSYSVLVMRLRGADRGGAERFLKQVREGREDTN